MHLHSETAVFNACRTLFGKEVNLSRDFLNYLQPSGAKTAFRSRAKAHHPDAHASASKNIRNQQTERFREIRQAYDLIIEFLENRQHYDPEAQAAETSRQTLEDTIDPPRIRHVQLLPWESLLSATDRSPGLAKTAETNARRPCPEMGLAFRYQGQPNSAAPWPCRALRQKSD